MEQRVLGRSGLVLSRLGFGTLTVGPSQAKLSIERSAELIRYALSRGINWLDTADLYETYPHIERALRGVREQPIICSRSYAYDKETLERSLERARRALNRDVIDIFLLHEQESVLTLAGHARAYDALLEARERGIVRAVGVSTHAVSVVEAIVEAACGDHTNHWDGVSQGGNPETDVVLLC